MANTRGHWRRPAGFKPVYNPLDTARYVSRRARLVRGSMIAPNEKTRRPGGGWYLWFNSIRGPKTLTGRHRVEVIRGDETIGGGDDPNKVVPPTGDAWFQVLWFTRTFTGTYYYWNSPGLPSGGPYPYYEWGYFVQAPDFSPIVYRIDEPYLLSDFSEVETSPNYYSVEDTGRSVRVIYLEPGAYSRYVGAVNRHTWNVYSHLDVLLYTYEVNLSQFSAPSSSDSRWLTAEETLSFDSTYLMNATEEQPPYEIPPVGPGSELPEKFLLGTGGWAYHCTCPDFSFTEGPYQWPHFPSDRSTRSWARTRPKFPCKHIASSARAIGDMTSYRDWTIQGRKDIFPRQLRDYDFYRVRPETYDVPMVLQLRKLMSRLNYRSRRAPRPRRPRWNDAVKAWVSAQREARREQQQQAWADDRKLTRSIEEHNQRVLEGISRAGDAAEGAAANTSSGLGNVQQQRWAARDKAVNQYLDNNHLYDPNVPEDRQAFNEGRPSDRPVIRSTVAAPDLHDSDGDKP